MTIDSFSNVFEYVFDPGGERLRGERGDVCLTCGPRGRSAERERGVFFEAAAACAGEPSRFAAAAALLCEMLALRQRPVHEDAIRRTRRAVETLWRDASAILLVGAPARTSQRERPGLRDV